MHYTTTKLCRQISMRDVRADNGKVSPIPAAPIAVVVVWFLPPFVCVSVYVFRTLSQKSDAARISKRGSQMFHDESFKPICLGVKRLKVLSLCHESQKQFRRGSLHFCECWLLPVIHYSRALARTFA